MGFPKCTTFLRIPPGREGSAYCPSNHLKSSGMVSTVFMGALYNTISILANHDVLMYNALREHKGVSVHGIG